MLPSFSPIAVVVVAVFTSVRFPVVGVLVWDRQRRNSGDPRKWKRFESISLQSIAMNEECHSFHLFIGFFS